MNIPIDRFEHCNFTPDEVLVSFGLMRLYDGLIQKVSGVGAWLTGAHLAAFESQATALGLPYRKEGAKLSIKWR